MIELQICILALGLILSCNKRMGLANPFQVYFGIWLLVLSWFYVTADSYPALVPVFKLLTLAAAGLSLALLLYVRKYSHFDSGTCRGFEVETRNSLIYLLQLAVIVSVPFAYQNAMVLAGGADIFSKVGYSTLRAALLVQKGHSIYGYLCTLSMLLTSVMVYQFKPEDTASRRALTVLSFVATVFYLMLSTGRTFWLLFFCLLFVPWVLAGRLRFKGVIIAGALLFASFTVVTILLGKVTSLLGVYQHLKDYTVAPFVSFGELFKHGSPLFFGEYTFRFFISIMNYLHLTDLTPVPMIRDALGVPGLVNVYTVYEVYWLDFSYLGFLVPTALLYVNWWLYVRAKSVVGPWLFLYAASFFPLIMQFFNDQYMTLLSMWIQIAFFCFLFIKIQPTNNDTQTR